MLTKKPQYILFNNKRGKEKEGEEKERQGGREGCVVGGQKSDRDILSRNISLLQNKLPS